MDERSGGRRPGGYLQRPAPSGLADVVDIVLGRGLVIDAYAQVSLLGIELITVDARVVVGSVETYLRFAEVTKRLHLAARGGMDIAEMPGHLTERFYYGAARGVIEGTQDVLFGRPR